LESIQLIFEVSVRDKSITVLIELLEYLEDLNWTREHFILNVLHDLLYSLVVNLVIIDFIQVQVTVHLGRRRITSLSVVQLLAYVVLVSEYEGSDLTDIGGTVSIVNKSREEPFDVSLRHFL
jgi:hypothetical protein